MRRGRIFCLMVTVVFIFAASFEFAGAAQVYDERTETIRYNGHTVYLGVSSPEVNVSGNPAYLYSYNIDGNNFYRLRDLAKAFNRTNSKFNVTWNGTVKKVELITGQNYIEGEATSGISGSWPPVVNAGQSEIYIDGSPKFCTAFNINGNNYYKLRDLADNLDFKLDWDANKKSIEIFPKALEGTVELLSPDISSGISAKATFSNWDSIETSYIQSIKNGYLQVVRVNQGSGKLAITDYDANYTPINKRVIDFELPLFGGFYSGEHYDYIAFGQENNDESDDKEVIRIVKYDKNGKRLGSVAIKDCYTSIPFRATRGQMAENGNVLVLHTARLRYLTPDDGLKHQSQLTVSIDTGSMRVLNSSELGRFQPNHVSHSFMQRVVLDDDKIVLVDHGDAYPRSIVLHKSQNSAWDSSYTYDKTTIYPILGKVGDNYTGVSIGDLEISSSSYLTVFNTSNLSSLKDSGYGNYVESRDIMISAVPRHSSSGGWSDSIVLEEYIGTNKIGSIPTMVKINSEKFMVLWQEFDRADRKYYNSNSPDGILKYVYVDSRGCPISEVLSKPGVILSDCKPIFDRNKVIWFLDTSGKRTFYEIDVQ